MKPESVTSPRVLVFDSGVGGLTVAAEIAAMLPGVAMIYACDNGFFPYGTKDEDELVERVDAVISALIARAAPDLIVIACNTASTVALPRLRRRTSIPVVGVVPAIKPAAARSRSRAVGLLGTPGTVRRAYTQELIDRFAADCRVVRVGSVDLVTMAERKLQGEPADRTALAAILQPFFGEGEGEGRVDTVVLACTHFPWLREEMAALSPPETAWIDSGEAVARRVRTLLEDAGMNATSGEAAPPAARRVFFTARDEAIESRLSAFRRFGYSEAQLVAV